MWDEYLMVTGRSYIILVFCDHLIEPVPFLFGLDIKLNLGAHKAIECPYEKFVLVQNRSLWPKY